VVGHVWMLSCKFMRSGYSAHLDHLLDGITCIKAILRSPYFLFTGIL